nr:hypothetical protein [Tanacetum cinerariifolium]
MLVPLVVDGEGSRQPSKPQPPSSTTPPEQVLANVSQPQKTHTPRRTKRGQDIKIPLSSGPPKKVEVNTSRSGEESMEHQEDLTDFIPPTPYDSPLLGGHTPRSDEGRPNINELMNICNKLSNMVLTLEQFKTTQYLVIKRLKKKVKRLEKKQRA